MTMVEDNIGIDALAQRIRRYVHEHPNAADTLEGVAAWWLGGGTEGEWLESVKTALERLAASGELSRRTLGDGTVIFERNKERDRT